MQEVHTTLPVGSIARDRYVVETLLGKGGFGAVYRVRDQRVKGNRYALKEVIDPYRKGRTRKERNRFTFEGEVLKRLDHRALPRVYRVFEDDDHTRAYMLMDFIDGPNLELLRLQQPGKRLSPARVLRIMAPIMDAVTYLHSQQPPIIHRDIKPANIIVPATDDDAVLVDFDIAKEVEPDSTTTAVRRCTPGYGSPEQYSRGTNTRTDIYGLGATIYTLLTGTVPPDALHRMTQIRGKGIDPLESIDQLVPTVPKQIAEAVHRAMAVHSNDRFTTVEEFWQALDTHSTAKDLAIPAVAPSSSSLSPGSSQVTSGTTTTTTFRKKSQATPSPVTPQPETPLPVTPLQDPGSRPKKRRVLLVILVLLALFFFFVSAVSFWIVLVNQHGVKSSIPILRPRSTVVTSVTPIAGPTKKPTIVSTSGAGSPGPGTIPTAPATSVPPSTAVPTQPPTLLPTPTPNPTAVPNPYPGLAGSYSGGLVDTAPNPNITASMLLSSIQQQQGNVSGYFSVGSPLLGNGPFSGTVGTNKYIQFTVRGYNGNAPLYFWGFVQANRSLQGQYCSLDQNGHCSANAGAGGYWTVSPAAAGGSISLLSHETPFFVV